MCVGGGGGAQFYTNILLTFGGIVVDYWYSLTKLETIGIHFTDLWGPVRCFTMRDDRFILTRVIRGGGVSVVLHLSLTDIMEYFRLLSYTSASILLAFWGMAGCFTQHISLFLTKLRSGSPILVSHHHLGACQVVWVLYMRAFYLQSN